MAMQFVDGFDTYNSPTQVQNGGWATTSVAASGFYATAGRFGGGAIGAQNAEWTTGVNHGLGETRIYAFSVRPPSTAGSATLFELISTLGVASASLFRMADGTLVVQRGVAKTTVNSYPNTAPVGVWTNIQFVVQMNSANNTADGSGSLYINGLLVGSFTNVAWVANSGTPAIPVSLSLNGVATGPNTLANSFLFDDVIVMDTVGPYMGAALPDHRVETLVVTNDGTDTGWTPNSGTRSAAVATDDGDTLHIQTTTAGDRASFEASNLTPTVNTVHGVQVRLVARKTDAATRNLRGYIKLGSGRTFGTTVPTPTGSYVHLRSVGVYQNPNTLVQLSPADVNAAEVGVEAVT